MYLTINLTKGNVSSFKIHSGYIQDTIYPTFKMHGKQDTSRYNRDTRDTSGYTTRYVYRPYLDPYFLLRLDAAWATPSPPAELPQSHAGYMRDTCGIHYENIIKVTLEALKIHARYIRDTFGIHDAIHVSHSNAIQQEMYLTCRRHAGCMRDTAAVPNCRL